MKQIRIPAAPVLFAPVLFASIVFLACGLGGCSNSSSEGATVAVEEPPTGRNGFFVGETGARMPRDSDHTIEIDAGDVDGDGDLDIVTANVNKEQNRIYINDGTGHFTDETLNPDSTGKRLPPVGDTTADVELADVDGDGDLDIFYANTTFDGQQNRLLINDGNGYFTGETLARLPLLDDYSRDAIFLDVDSDGDLDILVANSIFLGSQTGGQFNRILINDGTGHFTDETFDADDDPLRIPKDPGSTRDIAGADVDHDGDIDLFVANRAISNQNRLFLNDATGYFTDATGAMLPFDYQSSRDADFGDADGDGDPDIYICNASKFGAQNRIWINDGLGNFTDESLNPDGSQMRLPPQEEISKDADWADVDGDRDLDIALANCRHENGVIPTETGQQNRIFINYPGGYFLDETLKPNGAPNRFNPSKDNTYDIDFFDCDNDGDMDVLVGNRTQQNRLLINTSTRRNQITLISPPQGAKFSSPPTFKWTIGDHDAFEIEFSVDPNFDMIDWSDLKWKVGTKVMSYDLPPHIFGKAPAGIPIFWRVAGVDIDLPKLKKIYSQYSGFITVVR